MVEPPKRRKRKNTPSDRARDARKLIERIEATTGERHDLWAEGAQPNLTERATNELETLHLDKRTMRRDIYAAAPQLEGRPVFRGSPGGRA